MSSNLGCMTFNHQYSQQQQQQFQQGYRSNVVATVTLHQSGAVSRTSSRCDSVRSETGESNCSNISSSSVDDVCTGQFAMAPSSSQMYHNLSMQSYPQQQQQQQQEQQQCFWSSSHYEMHNQQHQQHQQNQQQQPLVQYFRQQQQQQQQQQQCYRQPHPVIQMQQPFIQQQSNSCYWPRNTSPAQQQLQHIHQQQCQFVCPSVSSPSSSHPATVASSSSSPSIHSPLSNQSQPEAAAGLTAPFPCPTSAQVDSGHIDSGHVDSADAADAFCPHSDHSASSGAAVAVSVAVTVSVPVGWTRNVSAGSVTYIR